MIIRNRLKELRSAAKLTQTEMAKLIDRDIYTVNKHENHLRAINTQDAAAYAKVFKVHSAELFSGVLEDV